MLTLITETVTQAFASWESVGRPGFDFLKFAWPCLLGAGMAGLVDSMGGGGGLISAPALLMTGIHPSFILGTNKSMSTLGSVAALVRYTRAGLLPSLPPATWLRLAFIACVAGVAGAAFSTLSFIVSNLRFLIPILLACVMLFIIKRWWWDEKKLTRAKNSFDESATRCAPSTSPPSEPTPSARAPTETLVTPRTQGWIGVIAGYDGVFGPGTGTFFLSLFEKAGFSTLQANAITKVFNFSSNIGALCYFSINGHVMWALGLSGAGFYLIGNYLGAGLVLKRGQGIVRVAVCTMTSLLIIKFAAENW